jgi:peptide deformylase
MAVKQIIKIGEPVLRETTKFVSNFSDPQITELITDLKDTMRSNELIGLATPQIGLNLSVFVSEILKTPTRKDIYDPLRIYINPKISEFSPETSLGWEGCGSIPDIFGQVDRPNEVTVEFLDETGKKQTLTCAGLLARVVQHEIDHLNGVLFTDIADQKSFVSRDFYIKHIKGS